MLWKTVVCFLFVRFKNLTLRSEEVVPLSRFRQCSAECMAHSHHTPQITPPLCNSVQTLTSCPKTLCLWTINNRIDSLVIPCLIQWTHYQLPDKCPNKHLDIYLLQLLVKTIWLPPSKTEGRQIKENALKHSIKNNVRRTLKTMHVLCSCLKVVCTLLEMKNIISFQIIVINKCLSTNNLAFTEFT